MNATNVAVVSAALGAAISAQISTILLSTTAPLLLLPLLAADSRENFEEDEWARRMLLRRRLRAIEARMNNRGQNRVQPYQSPLPYNRFQFNLTL